MLVTRESAVFEIGDNINLESNHFETCKPIDRNSKDYVTLVRFINDVLRSCVDSKRVDNKDNNYFRQLLTATPIY